MAPARSAPPPSWCALTHHPASTYDAGKTLPTDSRWLSLCNQAADLWASDGIMGFFYGAEGQIFNASVKQGLTMMMKERLQVTLPSFSLYCTCHQPAGHSGRTMARFYGDGTENVDLLFALFVQFLAFSMFMPEHLARLAGKA